MLGVKPRNMLTQLREWALLGFFTHTGFGTYALNTPTSPASSTNEPDLNYATLAATLVGPPLTR